MALRPSAPVGAGQVGALPLPLPDCSPSEDLSPLPDRPMTSSTAATATTTTTPMPVAIIRRRRSLAAAALRGAAARACRSPRTFGALLNVPFRGPARGSIVPTRRYDPA